MLTCSPPTAASSRRVRTRDTIAAPESNVSPRPIHTHSPVTSGSTVCRIAGSAAAIDLEQPLEAVPVGMLLAQERGPPRRTDALAALRLVEQPAHLGGELFGR